MDAPAGYREPTFGQRLLARLMDGLLLVSVVTVVGIVLDGTTRLAVGLALAAVYEIGLVARDGRTLGKRAMGLRIMSFPDGTRPTPGQAGLRWAVPFAASLVAPFVPGVAGVVTLLVYLPVIQAPLHRGVHDRVAGTIVTADAA